HCRLDVTRIGRGILTRAVHTSCRPLFWPISCPRSIVADLLSPRAPNSRGVQSRGRPTWGEVLRKSVAARGRAREANRDRTADGGGGPDSQADGHSVGWAQP